MVGGNEWALLCVGLIGCAPPSGLNYSAPGGSRVERDKLVQFWSINGELVELHALDPEPGCYVLGVKYKIIFDRINSDLTIVAVGLPMAYAEFLAQTHHSEYKSGEIPFAFQVRAKHTYWVTATFTGDEFLPRIVDRDASGTRVGQIEPTNNVQELLDCKANKLKPVAD